MSDFVPQTKNSRWSPDWKHPWLTALVVSVAVHAGTVVVASLTASAPRPLRAATPDPARPYTVATYAKKTADAQLKVKRIVHVANEMEELRRRAGASYEKRTGRKPPPTESPREKNAGESTPTAAGAALRPVTRPAGNAVRKDRPLAANKAMTLPVQPSPMPTHRRPVAKPLPGDASPAQVATEQARQALLQRKRKVALDRTLQEARKANAEAARTAAKKIPAKAGGPIPIDRTKVRRYDRVKLPEPPIPSGPKDRKEIAYTETEERAVKAIQAQQRALKALDRVGEILERNPARETPAGAKVAREAMAEVAKAQKEAGEAQRAVRQSLRENGATIPGYKAAQNADLRRAMRAQTKANVARKRMETSLKNGNAGKTRATLALALAAQRDAARTQENAAAKLEGGFGPPPKAPEPDPNHTHNEKCFLAGGTCSPFGRAGGRSDHRKDRETPSLEAALEAAQGAQARIDRLYDEIRALERTTASGKPPETGEARKAGNGGVPDESKVRLRGGPSAPASAVNAAEQQINAMVSRAQRLLDQAQSREGTAATGFTDRMVALASQDQGGKQADVSGYMTSEREGKTTYRNRVPGDPDYIAPPPPPVLPGGAIRAIPGRRITGADGALANWMYVDSWYVIGPFPNPARRNRDTAFPPEADVNLDAVYPGKDGRTLKWRFCQFNNAEMIPPDADEYAVYYLFTELYSDRERDAWLAVGSDDQSTLWVNQQLVWKSGSQLKGWQIGEGLRRVHLQKGYNPVLLRVENGWYALVVSLVIAPK